jgi:hypothetical protein
MRKEGDRLINRTHSSPNPYWLCWRRSPPLHEDFPPIPDLPPDPVDLRFPTFSIPTSQLAVASGLEQDPSHGPEGTHRALHAGVVWLCGSYLDSFS